MPKLKTAPRLPEEDETPGDGGGQPVRLDIVDNVGVGPRLAGADDSGIGSPALSLQQLLIDGWEDGPLEDARRWPQGLTILVSGGCAIALWGLIIWAALALFHIHLA